MKMNDRISGNQRLTQDVQTEMENVDDLHRRISHMIECSYIHAEELASLFHNAGQSEDAQDGGLPDTQTLSALAESFSLSLTDSKSRHDRLLAQLYPHLSSAERICFYQSLLASTPDTAAPIAARLLGQTEAIEMTARGTIAYQHNIYADEAFLHFSRVLPTAKAVYSSNFSAVCDQVFNGQCEYCILPLETTEDGKLVRFYHLIQRYELKIVLTCSVTTSDNRNETVFGLCRRGLLWPRLLLPNKEFSFEFIFRQEPDHASLNEVLTAAAACSLSLVRTDCLPRSDEEILIGAGYPFALRFEIPASRESHSPESDFLAFLLYLSLHSPSYLPLGIYQHL
jgi:hypothetical protein